jgi:transposase-like protein
MFTVTVLAKHVFRNSLLHRMARIRYSKKLAEKICQRLRRGDSVLAIARDPGMPPRSTLRYWIKTDKDGLFAECPQRPGKGAPPTLYTKRLAGEICRRLASGRSLSSIARDFGMPAAPTVIDWVNKDIDGLKAVYARARELGRYTLADEIIELADDRSKDWEQVRGKRRLNRGHLARARLRIAARRFLWINTRPTHERGPLTIEIVRFGGDPDS